MSTSHWERVSLSEIAEVRLGRQRSPRPSIGPNMRPYMRAANVTWNGISLHDVKEMDFTPAEFETYALRRGDVLLSEAPEVRRRSESRRSGTTRFRTAAFRTR